MREFFNSGDDAALKGVSQKNALIKRGIVACMAARGGFTLADLAQELHVSIPTVTKLVGELVVEGIVADEGKVETAGGRRPNMFGLADSSVCFVGVDVGRDNMRFVVTDLKNNVMASAVDAEFVLADTASGREDICRRINGFIDGCGVSRDKLLGIGVCMAGRVNPQTGRSYMYFASAEEPFADVVAQATGLKVLLENDTRARCYAEYCAGIGQRVEDMLYLHLGRGVAIGIITGGRLYYGKSGFAGEFGHAPFFDNEIICACGKKGCLETEVSGAAVERKFAESVAGGANTVLKGRMAEGLPVRIDDIIEAARHDDTLSIELIGEAGTKIGRSVAFLINIFNPELVIIGGSMSHAGDYLMLPLKAATNKYSLGLVYNDTEFRVSHMGDDAGALGAAMLIRNEIIGLR